MQEYEGYTEQVLAIKGEMFGVEVEYNGTVQVGFHPTLTIILQTSDRLTHFDQEIYAQFERDHPDVEINFGTNATLDALEANSSNIQRRNKVRPTIFLFNFGISR